MSSEQNFSLGITYNNASSYLSGSGSSLINIPYSFSSYKGAVGLPNAGNINAYVTLKDAAKNILFPNNVARPSSVGGDYYASADNENSNARVNFEIDGVTVTTGLNLKYDDKKYSIDSSSIHPTRGSTIRFLLHPYGTYAIFSKGGVYIGSINLVFTFVRYDFSAEGQTGVTASVSSANGYDGDSVTWTASVQRGYTFDGWYADAARTQLVSTAQSYTETVSGADRTLYAKVTAPATKTLTVTYDGRNIVSRPSTGSSAAVSYNGIQLFTLESGTKTLNCNRKLMLGDVVVDGTTLNCALKLMKSNIFISMT